MSKIDVLAIGDTVTDAVQVVVEEKIDMFNSAGKVNL